MFRKILESDYFSAFSLCAASAQWLTLQSFNLSHRGAKAAPIGDSTHASTPQNVWLDEASNAVWPAGYVEGTLVLTELARLMVCVTATSALKHTRTTQPRLDAARPLLCGANAIANTFLFSQISSYSHALCSQAPPGYLEGRLMWHSCHTYMQIQHLCTHPNSNCVLVISKKAVICRKNWLSWRNFHTPWSPSGSSQEQ